METKQTAVEWLLKMLHSPICNGFIQGRREIPYAIVQQAKQMEKEQITSAYMICDDSGTLEESELYAEQYYNETYGK